MPEHDNLLGPGTDLVLSLFALSLMLIGVVSGLYFESVNALVTAEENIKDFESVTDKFQDAGSKLNQLRSLKKENKVLRGELNTQKKMVMEALVALKRSEKELSSLKNQVELLDAQKTQAQNEKSKLENILNRVKKAQKNIPSRQTTTKLKAGHSNTPVPKRSPKGKQIYRIYAEGSPTQMYLYYKPAGSTKKRAVSRKEAHRVLKKVKKKSWFQPLCLRHCTRSFLKHCYEKA